MRRPDDFRIVLGGEEARAKLKKGIDIVCDVVKSTLGSYGRNVVLEHNRGHAPRITNDGVSIASEIVLEDEIENQGAQAVIDVAVHTNKEVGDGTTTSLVLAQAIIDKIFKEISGGKTLVSAGENRMEIYHKIQASRDKVSEAIKKMAKPVKTKEDLEKVAQVSMENDNLGKIIGDMVHKIGRDGFISVEEGFGIETETSVVDGMKFHGTYIHDILANHRQEVIVEDPFILITNERIETISQINWFVDWLIKAHQKKELVVITPGYTKDVIDAIANTVARNLFKLVAIKAPALNPGQFEDIAFYTGGYFFDREKGEIFYKSETLLQKGVGIADLGRAKKIKIDRDNVFIMDGKGDKEAVKQRIAALREEKDNVEMAPAIKKKFERRIASLAGAVGLIEIGSRNESERGYLKDKADDAVAACQAAMEEGIVPGGGLALKRIAETLPDDDILRDCLNKPYEQIQDNAGGNLAIDEEKIIDPAKVVRIAFESACAFAGLFATTDNVVAWKRRLLEREFKRLSQEPADV